MATVPNMRMGPGPLPAGTSAPGESGEAELFAQLLAALPGAVEPGEAPAATVRTAEAPAGEAEAETEAAEIPFAAILLDPPVVPAPPPAAAAVAPPTPKSAVPPPVVAAEAQPIQAPAIPVATAEATPEAAAESEVPSGKPLERTPPADAAKTPAEPRNRASATEPVRIVAHSPRVEVASAPPPEPAAADVPRREAAPAPSAELPAPIRAAVSVAAAIVEAEMPARTEARARPSRTVQPAAPIAEAPKPTAEAPPQPLPPFAVHSGPPPLVEQASAAAPVATTTPAEAMLERELDLAHDGEWLDRLARDIARSAGSEAPLRFRLNPETLGHLKVEIAQGDQGASVRLTAETETARAILAEAQPRLVAEARAQGVRIAETQVDVGGQASSGDPRRQETDRPGAQLRTAGRGGGEPEAAPARHRTSNDLYA